VAAFMVGVEVAFQVEAASTAERPPQVEAVSKAEVACALAAEAGPAEGRIRHLLPAMQVRAPRSPILPAHRVGTRRGPATITLDPGAVSVAETSVLEIPPRGPLPSATVGGIPLAVQMEAEDLRAGNRQPRLRTTAAASTSLAAIAHREHPARCVALRGKVARCGRILPPREMLFPGLNRFPPFTIRSPVHSPGVPGSGRIRGSLPLRALSEDRRSCEVEDFRVV
jgi:hypothetical protein